MIKATSCISKTQLRVNFGCEGLNRNNAFWFTGMNPPAGSGLRANGAGEVKGGRFEGGYSASHPPQQSRCPGIPARIPFPGSKWFQPIFPVLNTKITEQNHPVDSKIAWELFYHAKEKPKTGLKATESWLFSVTKLIRGIFISVRVRTLTVNK